MALARWQGIITDDAGNVVASPNFEVRREVAGSPLQRIYTDRAGATPAANPGVGDADGYVYFHVEGGAYRIRAWSGDFEREFRYVAVGTFAEADQGVLNDPGYLFEYEADTVAPPTEGFFRLNNADASLATEMYISKSTRAGYDVGARLMELDPGTQTKKHTVIVAGSELTGATWLVDSATDSGDYVTLTLSSHTGDTALEVDTFSIQREIAGPDGADGEGMFSRVRAAATGNVDLAAPGATIDGVAYATGELFLAQAQTDAAENGIYEWNGAAAAATRATGFTTYNSMPGVYVSVMEGATYADTLWRCTSDQGGTLGTDDLTFEQFSSGSTIYLVPEDYGAAGDGATDDTAAFASIATDLGTTPGTVALTQGKTYLVDTFDLPDDCLLLGNYATLKRRVNNSSPVLAVGERSTVRDLIVHGSLDTLGTTSATNSMTGIQLDNYAKAINCRSSYNYRHGIAGKPATTTYTGIQIIGCEARNNGANPSSAGTGSGDGINLTNVSDFVVRDCGAFDSARSDMVVTTYDWVGGTTDPSLTTGGLIENLKAGGAAYVGAEVNFEDATGVHLVNSYIPDCTVIFNGTDDVVLDNVHANRVYSVTGNRPTLVNSRINNSAASAELLTLTGNSLTVRDVRVTSTYATKTGNLVNLRAADSKGSVHNLFADGGNNAILINVDNFSGLDGANTSNVEIRLGPSGASADLLFSSGMFRVKGRTQIWISAAPTTGTWARGDLAWDSTPSTTAAAGWVCGTAGNPGTWLAMAALT